MCFKRLFLVFIFCMVAAVQLSAQNYFCKQVSLSFKQVSLQTVLNSISQQTSIVFSFDPTKVDLGKKVTVELKNKSVEEALPHVLDQGSLRYRSNGKFAILLPAGGKEAVRPGVLPVVNNLQPVPVPTPSPVREQYCYQAIDPLGIYLLVSSGDTVSVCHSLVTNMNTDMQTKTISPLKVSSNAANLSTTLRKQLALVVAALSMFQATAQTSKDVAIPERVKVYRPAFCVEAPVARPAQITFINPLGSDWKSTKNNTYNLSLNLVGGVNAGVSGAEFAGIYNITHGNMSGVQFAGLFNTNSCSVTGAQFAGLLNYARKGSASIQASGLYNRSDQGARVQIAGLTNQAPESKTGVQIAGFLNTADTAQTQIAVVNTLRHGGFQLGLVNIRDTTDAVMLGLVNIAKKGGLIEVELAGGFAQLLESNISLRTGSEKLYAILSLGHTFSSSSTPEFWGYGFGLGTTFRLQEKWRLNLEVLSIQLANKHFNTSFYNQLIQLRLVAAYRIAKRFSLFAGPSFNLLIANNSIENPLRQDAPYTIINSTGSRNRVQGWIGVTAGVRF